MITDNCEPRKPLIFFILGGPGAGKGTLCDSLVREMGFHHFSTGDLLRRELRENPQSEYSSSIRNHMSEGKLVSSELLLALLSEKILSIHEKEVKILLDGFPRNQENLEVWQSMDLDAKLDFKNAIFLECTLETMESNILERSKTSGRDDDRNLEIIKKRIEVYVEQTEPLLANFSKEGKMIRLDAEKSPEHIFQELKTKFKELDVFNSYS